MNIIDILILSVVEGLTEFLPISSTGHLILTSRILNIPPNNLTKTFEIVIQFGAILAVVVLYFRKFFDREIVKRVLAAFIPTSIVGFVFYPIIKGYFLEDSSVTLNALFWCGIILIVMELIFKKNKGRFLSSKKNQNISYKQALIIGFFQSLSVIPGVSRSAATIIGGLSVGLNRPAATEFSFLLAVPTMAAASALDIYKSREIISHSGFLTLTAGTILSFIFAMLSIKFLITFVKKHDFIPFGIYRIILAILFWVFVI